MMTNLSGCIWENLISKRIWVSYNKIILEMTQITIGKSELLQMFFFLLVYLYSGINNYCIATLEAGIFNQFLEDKNYVVH